MTRPSRHEAEPSVAESLPALVSGSSRHPPHDGATPESYHAACSLAQSRATAHHTLSAPMPGVAPPFMTLVRESIRDWTTHLRKGVKPDDTSEEGSSTAGRMRCCRPSLAGRTRPCFVILRNLAMFPCLLGERDNCNQKGIKRKGKE
jgi:hypothetical protein